MQRFHKSHFNVRRNIPTDEECLVICRGVNGSGNIKIVLGMKFTGSKKGIFVIQRKYVIDLPEETGLLGCKVPKTSIEPNLKLRVAKAKEINDKNFRDLLEGQSISYTS